jgi:hypothetical protein
MMVWAAPGVPYLVSPIMRRVVCYVAASCRVVASANHAHEWSVTRRSTVAGGLHVMHVMITPCAHMSCNHINNVWAHLGNV